MPTTLEAAEAAIKKQEDFMTTMDANEEKISAVVDAGRRLVTDGNINGERIQEKVDSIDQRLVVSTHRVFTVVVVKRLPDAFHLIDILFLSCRHKKNRAAASELLARLKDNRDLQKFLQDCQEVKHLQTPG